MSLKWSTPDRHNGVKPLPIIANEIYLAIFDQIATHPAETTKSELIRTLANLTLVCRFFRVACQPLLFKSLTFRGDKSDMSARRTWFNALVEKGSRATVLAIQAEHCQFVAWALDNWANTAFLDMHLDAIRHFSNIHTLEFHSVHISMSFWDLRGSFQNVKSMLFSECRFEAFTAHSLRDHSNVGLASLSVFGCHDFKFNHILALTLFVTQDSLRVLHTDDYLLCAALLGETGPESGPPIEELSLKFTSNWIANANFFIQQLENAPRIRTLSLTYGQPPVYMGIPSLTVSTLALPRLQSLHCPVKWAPSLAQNRLVEQLRLVDTYGHRMSADEIIAAVSASSAVIKDLEISLDSFCAIPIHELCPGLQDLTLTPNRNSSYENLLARFEDVCLAWDPSIRGPRSLKFALEETKVILDLPLQRGLIQSHFERAFPHILRIAFSKYFQWQRPSVTESHSHQWRLYATADREGLITMMKAAPSEEYQVKDYGGFFASLFTIDELPMTLRDSQDK